MNAPSAGGSASRRRAPRSSRRRFVAGVTAAAAGSAISPIGASARQATPTTSAGWPGTAAVQDVMEGIVATGGAPGVVWLVSNRGEVGSGAAGVMDLDTGEPMRPDSIFRIASVTKPIVAVAALTLVERGEIGLDDPVDPWLPELANRQVVRTLASPIDDTVPATRPITLRDILGFKMGLGRFVEPPGTYPIQEAFDASGVISVPPRMLPPADEFMAILGGLPLASQPGEVWRYNTPMDVASVLIQRITGGLLGDYLRETIFSPLGMVDTGFQVPGATVDRLAALYGRDQAGQLVVQDPAQGGEWSRPPDFESGGGGLVSTAVDLLAFGRMLVNGSRLGNGQLLSDALFREMTADTLTPKQKMEGNFYPDFWSTWGWGLGLGVITREGGIPSAGSVGWLGGTSTLLISDPVEDVVSILLFQLDDLRWFGPVFRTFWNTVYSAI